MTSCKSVRTATLAAILVIGCVTSAYAVPPPAPWVVRNIGPRITPGQVDVDPRGFWTIRASNGDVSQNSDSTLFTHQKLSGDGSILALLFGQEGGDPQLGKSGLMIRADDSAGAANVHLFMTSGRGVGVSYRPFPRHFTFFEGADRRYGTRQFPVWFRLQREGDKFTPFTSTDGFSWSQIHSPMILPGFPEEALVGITASSLYDGIVAAAYGNVTVVNGQTSPNLRVCSGNASALLTWDPVKGAAGYIVRRSAVNVPGFAADTLTPNPIKETSFADTSLPNGQAVRYLVSAVFDAGGQSVEGWTNAVIALPVPTPGNLIGCDIGLEATLMRGGILFDPATGVFRISGSGGDFGNVEDRGFLAFQTVNGDFQITARTLEKTTAKVGVMVRETLNSGSRMAFLGGTTAQGVAFQYRGETDGSTAFTGRPIVSAADYRTPMLVRLVRRGNTISPFVSLNGTDFIPGGTPQTFDPPLPPTLYVGYAISAMNPGVVLNSTFSDLSIGPAPAP
jgi:hypothetical protein